jgi:FkbM family methyltransferase
LRHSILSHSVKTWLHRVAGTNASSQPPTVSAAAEPPAVPEPAAPLSAISLPIDDDLPPVVVNPDGSNSYSRRERFIITELIYAHFLPDETFSILDGGARGGPSDPRWRAIGDKRLVIHGFEVENDECERLNRDAAERGLPHHYYPCALWNSEGPLTIHGNKAPGGISAYPQNVDLTNRWKFQNATQKFYAREMFHPTGETSLVPATTVDNWSRKNVIGEIDFLKLNVQGAELEILKGARGSLEPVLGIDLEVSFVESYLGRPMFSDVDAHLRHNGFHFFDLFGLHNMGRADSPVTSMHTPGLNPYQGQLIEAHGLYFRDPIASCADLETFGLARVLKLASIAEIYGQVEYSFELLGWLSRRLTQAGRTEEATRISELRDAAFRLHQRYLWAPAP